MAVFRLSGRGQGAERRRHVLGPDLHLPGYLRRSAIWKRAAIPKSEIQEIVDHFIMKLRMVRFLRTPAYDELFSGDPTWVTESIGGIGTDGRHMVTKNVLTASCTP